MIHLPRRTCRIAQRKSSASPNRKPFMTPVWVAYLNCVGLRREKPCEEFLQLIPVDVAGLDCNDELLLPRRQLQSHRVSLRKGRRKVRTDNCAKTDGGTMMRRYVVYEDGNASRTQAYVVARFRIDLDYISDAASQ
jgi:hypothetical protein